MSKSKTKTIKPLDGFSNVSDADVVSRGTAVQTGLTGNQNFLNPPVELAALKAAIEKLAALISEALDGSKKVIAEKHKQREAVIKMLRLLGRYVEVTCKDDMAIFKSSGFEPASTSPTPAQPLPRPSIRKVEHGTLSGQLLVQVGAVRKARSYELRYAPQGSGGVPANWTIQTLTSARAATPVNNLTPGTTYVFQARALGKLGWSEWSDLVARMCT